MESVNASIAPLPRKEDKCWLSLSSQSTCGARPSWLLPYLMNRCQTSTLSGMTPYQVWFNKKPDLSQFIMFGSKAWALVPKEKRSKFDSCSKLHYMVGYGENSYRLWNPDSRKVGNSKNVKFDERREVQLLVETLQLQQDDHEIQPPDEQRTTLVDAESVTDNDERNTPFHSAELSPTRYPKCTTIAQHRIAG